MPASSRGGDSTKANLVVQTLIFDESQITSKQNGNHPTWGGCCHTLHKNANRAVVIMTYQRVTGTVNAGAHPGSYNGQDAYNDMLVTNGTDNGDRTGECRNNAGGVPDVEQ